MIGGVNETLAELGGCKLKHRVLRRVFPWSWTLKTNNIKQKMEIVEDFKLMNMIAPNIEKKTYVNVVREENLLLIKSTTGFRKDH